MFEVTKLEGFDSHLQTVFSTSQTLTNYFVERDVLKIANYIAINNFIYHDSKGKSDLLVESHLLIMPDSLAKYTALLIIQCYNNNGKFDLKLSETSKKVLFDKKHQAMLEDLCFGKAVSLQTIKNVYS